MKVMKEKTEIKLFSLCCKAMVIEESNKDHKCLSCNKQQKPKIAKDRDIAAIYNDMRLNGLTTRSMAFKYHLTPLEAKYIIKRGGILSARRAKEGY